MLPCLAAAPDGTRLGYGGGYHDRFLPLACNAVKIALCRAVLLEPVLPRECHDVRADFVPVSYTHLDVYKRQLHATVLLAFYPLLTLFVFTLGIGLALAAATVFFRDVMHLWLSLIHI